MATGTTIVNNPYSLAPRIRRAGGSITVLLTSGCLGIAVVIEFLAVVIVR
jgi:hypothetical protein